MVNSRLTDDLVYRFYIAYPEAFEDLTNITSDELNANPTNDPNGLIWNITCALNTDGTTFDLEEPDYDESTSFCQRAGSREPMSKNASVVYDIFRATTEQSTVNPALKNSATIAFGLLAWRGQEMIGIMSVGEQDDAPFEVGDEISVVQFATDNAVDNIGTGENVTITQTTANRGVWAWEWPLAA
jgi:hypothetical protein